MPTNDWRRTGVPPDGFVIVPPDGKWGWAVLFGCCLSGLAAVSVTILFGVLLTDLIMLLHTDATTITWTLAISSGAGNMLGPVVTIIIDTYSCRSSVMVGGMIISIGFILSSYVDSVELLMVTYGVLSGIGSGLTFVPLPVMLSLYFRKYFGIAMGCLTGAYALSKLAVTPMIQLILEEYGCRGTLLIMGGFMLHVCVGASLFQPAPQHSSLAPKEDTNGTTEPSAVRTKSEKDTPKIEKLKLVESGVNHSDLAEVKNNHQMAEPETETDVFLVESQTKTQLELNSKWDRFEDHHISNVSLHLASSLDIFGSTNTEAFNKFNETTGDDNALEKKKKKKNTHCCSSWFRDKLLKSIDHTLLKEKVFYIVCFQQSLLLVAMVYSTTYLFPFGVETGLYPMQAAGLVSTRSIGELAGRLTGPMILAALKLPTRLTYMASVFLHGICLIVLTYMTTLVSAYAVAGIAGVLFGAAVGLNGLLIVETMGVKRLPSVLGLVAFFQGCFLLAAGPITGKIRDVTGAYSYCLILLGIMQFFIVALWAVKPFVMPREVNKKSNACCS